MQVNIRGTDKMREDEQNKFRTMHKEGTLVPVEKPAHVLAALAVRGTRSDPTKDGEALGNGVFVSWDDASLAAFQC